MVIISDGRRRFPDPYRGRDVVAVYSAFAVLLFAALAIVTWF